MKGETGVKGFWKAVSVGPDRLDGSDRRCTMPSRQTFAEIAESLKALLRLKPKEATGAHELILSAQPSIWADLEPSAVKTTIVDLSPFVPSHVVPYLSPSQLEQSVVLALTQAGWPADWIRQEYCVSMKPRVVADVVLLDSSGEPLLVLEIEGLRVGMGRAQFAASQVATARERLAQSGARWTCITDGSRYSLKDTSTGEERDFVSPPRPEALGVDVSACERAQTEAPYRLVRTETSEDLRRAFDDGSPDSLVLDFSLPFGIRLDDSHPSRALIPAELRDHTGRGYELQYALLTYGASLSNTESIALVAPAQLATANAGADLRDYLARKLGLTAHVELNSGNLFPHLRSALSLIYLGGQREEAYFDTLSDRADLIDLASRDWYTSLSNWLAGERAVHGFRKRAEELRDWSVTANDPELDRIRQRLERIGECRPLGELCEIVRGHHLPQDGSTDGSEDGVPFIRGVDLRQGVIDVGSARKIGQQAEVPERAVLRKGDLVMSVVRSEQSPIVVKLDDEPAVASSSIVVLRPRDETEPGVSAYLHEYLSSSTGRKLLSSEAASLGSRALQLNAASLREIPVPSINPKALRGMSQVRDTEAMLLAKAEEVKSHRLSLFDASNLNELLQNTAELRRTGAALAESVTRADTLDFQISSFFPHPLAYCYRLLAATSVPSELYGEQLRVAENILAFLGSVSLSLLQDPVELGASLEQFWQRGISPGDWREITGRCTSAFGEYEGHPLAQAILELDIRRTRRGFGKDIEYLITAKNDYKHDRGPKVEREYVEATEKTDEALGRCMERLAFFADHPIHRIQDVDPMRGRANQFRTKTLRYVGDHPGLQQDEFVKHEGLHKGDLYVSADGDYWVPLFPFMHVTTCPHCRTHETYFIDKWSASDEAAAMKSFERGHSEDSEEVAADLVAWNSAAESE